MVFSSYFFLIYWFCVKICRNIFDTDEKVEIPKAADSHMTSSMLDDELVK